MIKTIKKKRHNKQKKQDETKTKLIVGI
jgi:hypothetical protein